MTAALIAIVFGFLLGAAGVACLWRAVNIRDEVSIWLEDQDRRIARFERDDRLRRPWRYQQGGPLPASHPVWVATKGPEILIPRA